MSTVTIDKENAKAWLGLSYPEMIMNLSVIPGLIGFFSPQPWMSVLFGIAFVMQAVSMYLYLFRYKSKSSKTTFLLNKIGNVVSIVFIWGLMLFRLLSV
ncbi:MAG: hypothetical protein TR69_WS6001000745 [candidate division WS6 bacterium OLB20]|uniref:Uncharacterized protein n=1 Tax=candidate division WS6 bacterium OLB20 TaxID=1617426 RepID=A0A136LYK9_9BACT|nr:MAG: hypothetical protein TR69_WS6001000745 [candidate division WS6 bacterium OLB20]